MSIKTPGSTPVQNIASINSPAGFGMGKSQGTNFLLTSQNPAEAAAQNAASLFLSSDQSSAPALVAGGAKTAAIGTTLPAPLDSGGVAARRNPGKGLEAPNPVSGGRVAATANLSMTFHNELYRRSGGTLGIAPTAAQLAHQASGGAQLSDYEWNSMSAGKYATTAGEEMLWHQTGGRLGLPGDPNVRTKTVATHETGPYPPGQKA